MSAKSSTAFELAPMIAAECLGERVQKTTPLLGLGSVNQIFVVQTTSATFVVRMNDDARARQDYVKERWCMVQAAAQGVPGPQVLAFGQRENFAYMLQTFVAGTHGADRALDSTAIWRAIGHYARLIHAIPVVGYGEQLVDPERGQFTAPQHLGFDGTWPGFIGYNVESLTADDPLLALGVLTQAQRPIIRQLFAELQGQIFTFGLNHGDLSLKNTIVAATSQVHLLDWGSAEVHITPHWDLIQILAAQAELNAAVSIQAYLAGYGLSPAEFAALQPTLATLRLLGAFDKLRWALDCSPEQVAPFAAQTQPLVHSYLAGASIAG